MVGTRAIVILEQMVKQSVQYMVYSLVAKTVGMSGKTVEGLSVEGGGDLMVERMV